MPVEGKPITVHWEDLKRFEVEAFKIAGLSPEDAEKVADTCVQADLRGVHTHGAFHLLRYCRRLRGGGANARPDIGVVKETENTALLDGDNGLGQVICIRAMEIAIAKARGRGVSAIAVHRSNHFGAAAYYAMMAVEQGMIGYITTNVSSRLAPTGGITACYGNNPIAYAIPTGKEPTVILDMSLSVVARGKIRLAANRGAKIPLDWATDKHGVPTDDPKRALEGLLLPIAGYKGYSLALVGEVLSAVMSGANVGRDVGQLTLDDAVTPRNIGHFCMAIDVNCFMPIEEFRQRMDALIHQIKSSGLAKGVERIYLPGEIEYLKWRERLTNGIPLKPEIWQVLCDVRQELEMKTSLPTPMN